MSKKQVKKARGPRTITRDVTVKIRFADQENAEIKERDCSILAALQGGQGTFDNGVDKA